MTFYTFSLYCKLCWNLFEFETTNSKIIAELEDAGLASNFCCDPCFNELKELKKEEKNENRRNRRNE